MNGESSRAVKMAFGLTHVQVIGQYRNDDAGRLKQTCMCHGRRGDRAGARDKNRNQEFAH
jgi:hypothetical protein